MKRIRNFALIAHVDHGKSTLADRILELTGALPKREMKDQFLDKMDIERERGITIKSQTVRLSYRSNNGVEYIYNLIDTPGHVDFGYEVSKSLSACEGALLIIDASQGVEAQTLANLYLALESGLTIIPVINKIDLSNSNLKKVKEEIKNITGIHTEFFILVSGKLGVGIEKLLEEIHEKIPYPQERETKFKALIFDSWFDSFKGVIVLVRVFSGCIKSDQFILLMNKDKKFLVQEVGVYSPRSIILERLSAGDVGFIVANIKNIHDAKVGDTITLVDNPVKNSLTGFENKNPMVFVGIFPIKSINYNKLQDALLKLSLNDSSFTYRKESSTALGFGFRCGFLGLLHSEVIKERLEREFNLNLLTTAPTVVYRGYLKSGQILEIDSPSKMPDSYLIDDIKEPFVQANIHTPDKYIGSILTLCEEKRGKQQSIDYFLDRYVIIRYLLPMSETIFDFFDKLKTLSKGYASFDYRVFNYLSTKLSKVDILLNGKMVDALSIITYEDLAYKRGRIICKQMKTVIPKQYYQIIIQAIIGGKIIARETISALRKDVTIKCYGGDISRKKKLLAKQKKGKRRMKKFGRIDIPQAAFLSALKID